jgi:hypothetical protein
MRGITVQRETVDDLARLFWGQGANRALAACM